jgi:FAD/FMN-containing dehydrogenase
MGLNRRRFLRALGASFAAASLGAACGSRGSSSGGPSPPGSGGNGDPDMTPPDMTPCDGSPAVDPAMLTGRIVRPGDPEYDASRAGYNGRFSIRPQLIVYAANATDVANAVRWAREHDVPLRARSSGHSYEAYSIVADGLVLDVSGIADCGYDPVSGIARIGTGCQLLPAYDTLSQSGVTVPSGSCGSLAIAGITLGGGVGLMARQLGLTCDSLRACDIVTADGQLRRASAGENADLFWALRGGGGGNFGIVTAFEFAVRPAADVSIYTVQWSIDDFAAVMSAWQAWAPYTDPALFSILSVDRKNVYSVGQFIGSTGDLQNRLAPLLAAGTPANLMIKGMSMLEAARMFGDDNAASRPKFKNGSAYVAAALPDAALATMVQLVSSGPGPNNTLQLDGLGGAIADVAEDATAFAHRHALFSLQVEAYWSDDGDEAANRAWVQSARQALAPYTTGAYVNYIDSDQADFANAYYGSNLSRLVSVKRSYDPEGFFAFPQAIPLS